MPTQGLLASKASKSAPLLFLQSQYRLPYSGFPPPPPSQCDLGDNLFKQPCEELLERFLK